MTQDHIAIDETLQARAEAQADAQRAHSRVLLLAHAHIAHYTRSNMSRPNDPRDVCIVGTARTACGSLQGKLSSVKVTDLAASAIRGASARARMWLTEPSFVLTNRLHLHVNAALRGDVEAVARAGIAPSAVEEVILGHVISAGVGQAPAKQAALKAGLRDSIACTTVNKVCASGMKGPLVLSCHSLDDSSCDVLLIASCALFVYCVCVRVLCGHAALMFGAQAIKLGLQDVVVVGGMESMSQAPHMSKQARSGARFGDLTFVDAIQSVRPLA